MPYHVRLTVPRAHSLGARGTVSRTQGTWTWTGAGAWPRRWVMAWTSAYARAARLSAAGRPNTMISFAKSCHLSGRGGRSRRRHSLDDPAAVARLLDSLREAGAEEQTTALADRLPEAGMFELFREQEGRQDRFRFGREADGSPARPWAWEDLD